MKTYDQMFAILDRTGDASDILRVDDVPMLFSSGIACDSLVEKLNGIADRDYDGRYHYEKIRVDVIGPAEELDESDLEDDVVTAVDRYKKP